MSKQGRGARKRAKERRKAQKRARKEARQAEWAAAAKAGTNRKKKRSAKTTGGVRLKRHAAAYCGNIGCIKCIPRFCDPKLAKPGTCLYGKQFRK